MKAVACILITILACAVDALFDCRRDPMNLCKNGATCNTADGTCTGCTAGTYEGYDCSVVVADKTHADCTPTNPCQNGGTCHRAATGAATFSCLCTVDYTGPTCTDKRYVVDCTTADQMSLTIRPHIDTFTGNIFAENKVGESACELTAATAGAPYMLANLANTNPTCDNAVVDPTTGAVSRKFIVRFIPNTLNVQDEIVTFICGGLTVDKTVASVTITGVPANIHQKEEGAGPVDADVEFTLQKSDGSSGTGNQDIGTPLTVQADLTAAGLVKFQAVRLEKCKAASHTDAATGGANYKELLFIENNCKHSDLEKTFDGAITRVGTAVKYTFKVFKIDTSNDVYITCTVKACAVASDCDAVLCTGDTVGSETGLGRKKRETGSVEKLLTRSYTVQDPLAAAAAKTIEEFKEAKACYQTWEMTATVVALAVALLLVLLLCLILIVKAILNRRAKTTYREDVSVTNSTDHLPHLPTIVSNKA